MCVRDSEEKLRGLKSLLLVFCTYHFMNIGMGRMIGENGFIIFFICGGGGGGEEKNDITGTDHNYLEINRRPHSRISRSELLEFIQKLDVSLIFLYWQVGDSRKIVLILTKILPSSDTDTIQRINSRFR